MRPRLRRSARLQPHAPPATSSRPSSQQQSTESSNSPIDTLMLPHTQANTARQVAVLTTENATLLSTQLNMNFLLNPASSSEDSLSEPRDDNSSNFDADFEFGFCDFDEVGFTAGLHDDDDGNRNMDTESNRRTGRTTRWIGGYKYTRANKSMAKLSYRCSHYRLQCKGKCDFVFRLQRYTNFVAHTCGRFAGDADAEDDQPSIVRDVTLAMKREVDRMAVTLTATRSSIWEMVRAKFYGTRDQTTGTVGLTREYVLRRVNRVRAEEFGGSVFGQIEVSPWSQVLAEDGTATDTNFHLFHFSYYDKASKTRERLLGWGHPVLLNMLKQKKTSVFIDGTFRCVPSRFKQCLVFTTYDPATKGYYPCAFVLCTSKTYAVYFHAMRLIFDFTDECMDPEFVYCDFEAGLIKAVRDHYPNAAPIGCLFHFKQACKRKMKKYRIPEAESRIAMRSGVLDMLTVVPQMKVEKQGVTWVKSHIADKCVAAGLVYSMDKWNEFWGYFQRTWIVKFPPKLWNVEPYTRNVVSRTNNPLERFNRELNAAIPGSHTNLPDFAASIEKLARRYANLKSDIEYGRARQPQRPPIRLPRPVQLPDITPDMTTNNLQDGIADDSSDDGELNLIRSDSRRLVVRSRDSSAPESLSRVLQAGNPYDSSENEDYAIRSESDSIY